MPAPGRTLCLADYQPVRGYGVLLSRPRLRWPDKAPFEILDFSFALDAEFSAGERVVRATLWSEPSGDRDLVPIDLTVNINTVTTWLSAGVPGRTYTVKLVVVGSFGRTVSAAIDIGINGGTGPNFVPPLSGVGGAVTDTSGVSITDTSGAPITAAPLVWVTGMMSDTNGRSLRDTYGRQITAR